LQVRNRLPAREDLQRILKMFASFSLLDLKQGHWKEPDAVFALYRSLLLVMNTADLEALAEWLKEQAAAPDDGEEEDYADTAEGWEDLDEPEDPGALLELEAGAEGEPADEEMPLAGDLGEEKAE